MKIRLLTSQVEAKNFVRRHFAYTHFTRVMKPNSCRLLALIERRNDMDRTYNMGYSQLLAPIVKSIQQQQKEIIALFDTGRDLTSKLASLAAQVAGLVSNEAKIFARLDRHVSEIAAEPPTPLPSSN